MFETIKNVQVTQQEIGQNHNQPAIEHGYQHRTFEQAKQHQTNYQAHEHQGWHCTA